jgi:chemotaxis family two-component system response regulator Rcp1
LNPNPGEVRRFSLRSRADDPGAAVPASGAKSILVVEDNPADVNLICEALQQHGVEGELIVAADGDKAICFIGAVDGQPEVACPDLVIIDLNLPKKPGTEVLKRMRQSDRFRHVPVVILSSSDDATDRDAVARLEASHYIRKPLRLQEFLSLGAVFKTILASS